MEDCLRFVEVLRSRLIGVYYDFPLEIRSQHE